MVKAKLGNVVHACNASYLAEISMIAIQGHPEQKVSETLSQQTSGSGSVYL
jgi:hypothetical protein